MLGAVEAAQAAGGADAEARARAAWQAARRCFSFLAPGAGKSFAIALGIVLFPHALTGAPPPSSGTRPTAARHMIIFPFRANVAELLDEGLAIEGRACRACRDAGIEADAAACDGCRDELHRAAEASPLCQRLGMRRSHVLELARRVYVLPERFNPRENVQHRRGFEEAMIVLATEDKVVLAVEACFITDGDIRALWFDEGDYGTNPARRRRVGLSWDTIQRTLWSSWVFLFSGTRAEWMLDMHELVRRARPRRPRAPTGAASAARPRPPPPAHPIPPPRRCATRTATSSAPSTRASSRSRRCAPTAWSSAAGASATSRSRLRTNS